MKKLVMGLSVALSALVGSSADFYHFDGESGAGMRGANYQNLTTFSACVWIRNAKIPEDSNDFNVILAQGALGGNAGFCVYFTSTGELSFQTRASSQKSLKVLVPCLTANDDTWHLVGVTHDWANKVKCIWVDGKLCASESNSSNVPNPSSTQYFCLGARRESSIQYPYEGDMAEASLWNTALTENDFARLMKLPADPTASGLIGYWPLNDCSGTECADLSAGAHNLTIVNTPGEWASDTSFVYQKGLQDAIAISDRDGGLTAGHGYGLQTFSACVWVRDLDPLKSSDTGITAIMSEGAAGDIAGWSVYIKTNDGNIYFQTLNKSGESHSVSAARSFLKDGLWHPIVVTHDWENRVKRLYIDGNLAAEAADITVDPKAAVAVPFAIGMRYATIGFGRSCPGSYAHASLWNKVLTPEEVQALSLQNLSGKEDGLVGYWPLDDGPLGPFADLAGSHPLSIREGTSGYSLDKVPFYEQQKVDLSVEAAGFGAFDVLARASGRTGETSAKVVWGPETAPRLHTNDLGTVELPEFSGKVSHGLMPGATYRAQVLVMTDDGTVRSPVIPFSVAELRVLADAYQELDYIESTGTQMIDTKYLPNPNTVVEMSLEFTTKWVSSGKGVFFGCHDSTKIFRFNFGGKATQIGCRLLNNDKSTVFNITDDIRTTRNELRIDAAGGKVSWGTVSVDVSANTNVHENYPMGLFGQNDEGVLKPFSQMNMRIYSCKISDAAGLVRDFVPCRELTGAKRAGLYDRVNGEFYPNAYGTDDFLPEGNDTSLYPLTIESLKDDRRGPVSPDYGTFYVPKGADVSLAALASVDPENPNAKFRGWRTSVFDGNVWQTTGESQEKSIKSAIFVQPAAPAKFIWNWGGKGLLIVVQ